MVQPNGQEEKRDYERNWDILFTIAFSHRDRTDQRRKPQDKQDIEYIGAYHIAYCDIGISFQCSREAYHELRARSPETHDGESDHKFAYTCLPGDGGSALNKPVSAQDYESQADQQTYNCHIGWF